MDSLSPSALLNIGLHLSPISQQSIIECLHQISECYIDHKESTECLSLILIYYKNLFLHNLNSTELSVEDFSQAICEICDFCFEIIQADETHQSSSSTLILELFPSMVQLLSQPKGKGSFTGPSGGRGPQVILDCFFAIKWPHCYVVFLCNIVTEIWEALYPRHKVTLKVLPPRLASSPHSLTRLVLSGQEKILESFCSNLENNDLQPLAAKRSAILDDLPGMIRVCANIVHIR
jgi:hypothetical protein